MNAAKSILLVVDDRDDRFLLERALRRAGVTNPIRVAKSAAEAWEVIGSERYEIEYRLPKVIILDLDLAVGGGWELLRRIREIGGTSVPVVAIGSSERNDDMQSAYDWGANAYFAKRVNLGEMAAMIRELEFLNLSVNSSTAFESAGEVS